VLGFPAVYPTYDLPDPELITLNLSVHKNTEPPGGKLNPPGGFVHSPCGTPLILLNEKEIIRVSKTVENYVL
jgi:hypothetical protein